jgi:hypothetical protein
MGKYLYAYKGGGMAATEEEQAKSMAEWQAWFGQLGDAVVEIGNPFAGSTEVTGSGTNGAAESHLTGYSIVSASSLDDAASKARGCPIFSSGGTVEVYEAIAM